MSLGDHASKGISYHLLVCAVATSLLGPGAASLRAAGDNIEQAQPTVGQETATAKAYLIPVKGEVNSRSKIEVLEIVGNKAKVKPL